MVNDQETKTVPAVPSTVAPATVPAHGDGIDCIDDGGGSIIKGAKMSFSNNAEYLAGGAVIKSPPREFILIERKRFVQEWGPGEGPPLSTREVLPGEFFPDVERMNEEAPKDRWRMVFGQLKGPFEKVQVLYLLEPATMAAFTFITSTVGGFKAVRELTDATKRKRMLDNNPHLFPVVTLGDTFMDTQYGGRQRPQFNVVRWIEIGKSAETPALAKPKTPNDDMGGDPIPF
jgi:hypothetical protein